MSSSSVRIGFAGCPGSSTDLLRLRLVVHGVPLLSLLGGHEPLALSKLLRLAVRHGDEDGVGGCRVGGLVLEVDVRTCQWSLVRGFVGRESPISRDTG